mgnify:CR=1 FL=1
MNKNKETCFLIRDLLPSFIDGITSKETNKIVEEHLQECTECKNSYEDMEKELNISETLETKKKIKIFKKINHKIRTLQIIILIILVFLFGTVLTKFTTLNKIETMAENINYNNYYEKIVETADKYTTQIEYYQNNNNLIILLTRIYNNNDIFKSVEYKYNGQEYRYSNMNGEVNLTEGYAPVEPLTQLQFLNKSLFGNIGISLMPGSLRNITLNDKNCYLLKVENYLNFIDKDTGLTIKEINIANNSVIDYSYSFDSVTDSKILELIEENTK